MKKKNVKMIALIALLILSIIWGFAYIGVTDALNNGWHPFSIVFLRGIVAAIAIFPFTIKKSYKDKGLFLAGLIIGVASFGGFTFQTLGQSMTTIGATSFITSLYLIFIPIILRVIFKKKEGWIIYLSCVIAIVGFFLLNLKLPLSFDTSNMLGNVFVFLGMLFFAIQIIAIAKFTQKYDVLQLTFIELVVMSFIALIAMSVSNDFSFHKEGLFSVIWVGLLSSGLCSVLQMWGEKHLHASVSGIIMSLEAVFALIFAMIFYDEYLNWIQIVGCILIFIPVILCQIPIKHKEEYKLEDEIKEESA